LDQLPSTIEPCPPKLKPHYPVIDFSQHSGQLSKSEDELSGLRSKNRTNGESLSGTPRSSQAAGGLNFTVDTGRAEAVPAPGTVLCAENIEADDDGPEIGESGDEGGTEK
jgi:hypothetical protein